MACIFILIYFFVSVGGVVVAAIAIK